MGLVQGFAQNTRLLAGVSQQMYCTDADILALLCHSGLASILEAT